MRVFVLATVALMLMAADAAEVSVTAQAGRIEVRARAASIAAVLDRIAATTGMRIVYDGARPRALVTVSGVWSTPTQAVLGVLAGTGLNYAFTTDPSGTRIGTLVLVELNPASGQAPARPPAPLPAMPAPEPEEPDVPVETESEPPSVPLRPSGGAPGMVRPPSGVPPTPIPGIEPPALPSNPSAPPLPPDRQQ